MKGALEVVYQRALHKGIIDMSLGGELIASFMLPKDTPFRETSIGGMADGVEYTLDHSSHGNLIAQPRIQSSHRCRTRRSSSSSKRRTLPTMKAMCPEDAGTCASDLAVALEVSLARNFHGGSKTVFVNRLFVSPL